MIRPPHDTIDLLPFRDVRKGYSRRVLQGDLMAGVTVAVFAIPQAIAYGILADVPPIHGLYAAVVASIVAALWGSSPFVNTGPTNSASLMTAAALSMTVPPEMRLQVLFFFTFLVGLVRWLMGVFRFGNLVHFVPESAFLGFTVGVGSMIALGRLHHLMGIAQTPARWFPRQVVEKLARLPDANPHALIVGLGTLAIMFGLSRYGKKYPVALLAIGLSIVYTRLVPGVDILLVRDIQPVPSGLPGFANPFFEGWTNWVPVLMPAVLAVALVGLIEAVSIGQVLAVKHRQHLNFNQEFFGQGLGMLVSSFFQGMPGSGSFSRSALLEQCGAVTRMASVFFGVATALALLFLPGLLDLIPAASLAGLLMFIGIRLVDPVRIKRLCRTSRMDAVVMVSTFLVTVLMKIEYGIFTGVVLAAMLLLNKSRVLHVQEILPSPDGGFDERPYTPGSLHEPSAVVALSVQGDLSYGVAHELLEQLNEIASIQDPEIIVVRTRRAFSIDFSCWNAIFEFAHSFQKGGGAVYLTGIDEPTQKTIHDARAHKWIPDDHLFMATETMMESFRTAMRQAADRVMHPERISAGWKDWLEDPVVISEEQILDIQRFLRGESIG
jgi:SulP family sulfate permease